MVLKAVLLAFLAIGVVTGENKFSSVLKRKQIQTSTNSNCEDIYVGDKFQRFDSTGDSIYSCVKEIINIDTIQEELEETQSKGTFDVFFKKYCASVSQVKTCAKNLLEKIRPCVKSTYSESIDAAKKLSDAFLDYACNNDGATFAAFMAANGMVCYRSNFERLAPCANTVQFFQALENDDLSVQDKCVKYDSFSSCMVNVLQTCDSPVPSNSFEGLFKALRKASPCA